MTKRAKHNIKKGEIRKIGSRLTKSLRGTISPDEIIFFGSRVKSKAKHTSDLDVVIIPKKKTWSSPSEYTNLMKKVSTKTNEIKYKGNKLDLQVVNTFNPAESGFCFTSLKKGKIKKKCTI